MNIDLMNFKDGNDFLKKTGMTTEEAIDFLSNLIKKLKKEEEGGKHSKYNSRNSISL